MHARAAIRGAIVTALGGLATTGSRVYHGRTRPLGESHEPTLLVYATVEKSDIHSMSDEGAILLRELTLAVEGRVIMADVPDDVLDDIAAEVEVAMQADPSLGGLALEVTLISTRITTQSPGENQAGEVRLEYRVQYRTRESAPATAV